MRRSAARLMPTSLTSGAKADGRFGKQDYGSIPEQDVYHGPGGDVLSGWQADRANLA